MREETYKIYYALDGANFSTKEACAEYEKESLACRIYMIPYNFIPCNTIPPYTMENADYILCLFPQNLEDFDAIKHWFFAETYDQLEAEADVIGSGMLFGVCVNAEATWKPYKEVAISDIDGVYTYFGTVSEFLNKIESEILGLVTGAFR